MPLFELGFWVQKPPANPPPQAILDGCHNRLVEEQLTDAWERVWQRQFRVAIRTYQILMTSCTLGLFAVLTAGYGTRALRSAACLTLLPAALYFSLNRFDIVPALLTGLSFFLLGRGRFLGSGIFLGAGVAVKAYPILLVPVLLRFLQADRRAVLRWLFGFAAILVVYATLSVTTFGLEGTLAPYRYQLGRALEGFTFFGTVLPEALGSPSTLARSGRLMTLIVAMAALGWQRPADLDTVLRRGAVLLLVFQALQVFYSPQWILWLLPLTVPLAMRQPLLAFPLIALDLATFATFPILYDRMGWFAQPGMFDLGYLTLVWLRLGLFLLLAWMLLFAPRPTVMAGAAAR